MGDVAKDLASGTVGGVAQLVVGHPFDTIKVKLQSQPAPVPGQPPKFSGAMDAVRQTLAAEGPRGLYKGMGAPLATVAVFNAVLFTVRGQMETLLRSEPGVPLTVGQQVIAGAGAGLAVSFLACPTELIKCRLQAQSAMAETGAGAGVVAVAVKYGGPMDVAKQVLKSEGGARGLFKGLVPTMAREIPGNAAMFGVYEAIKQLLAGGQDTSGLGRGSLMAAGGLAGAAFWASVYPTDVVKSVLQVDDYKNPKFSGSVDAFRKILASEGAKGLYKGFGPAMSRSIPANAACFLAYEVTSSCSDNDVDIISLPKLPIEILNMFVSFLPCFIFIKVASFLNAMHAIKGGWVGQMFALAKNNESEGRKSRIRRSKEERKEMVVAFIKKYQNLHNGSFPSLNLTHKEVGGSFYTVREIVRDVIQENRVLGPAKVIAEDQTIDQFLEHNPLGSIAAEPQDALSEASNDSQFANNQQRGTVQEMVLASDGHSFTLEHQIFGHGRAVHGTAVEVNGKETEDKELQVNVSVETENKVGEESVVSDGNCIGREYQMFDNGSQVDQKYKQRN
ncbi:hypothetical protein ACLB2K_072659 [Fragaria x ananassa]